VSSPITVTTSSQVLGPSIHLRQLYQTNSLAPTTNLTLLRIKFVVLPVSITMMLKHLIRTRWNTSRCSDHVTDPWGPTDASIELPWKFLPSSHYLRTFWACCDTSLWGKLTLLRRIRIGTGQTITIPDETTIREFFIRNPDITVSIPRDFSRLSSMPYSSIITISYDRWGNETRSYQSQGYMFR
jgi:hypothetical protein